MFGEENEDENFRGNRKTLVIPLKMVRDELSFQGESKSTWFDRSRNIFSLKTANV